MTKPYRTIPADELTASFSAKRKACIAARAAELIAEKLKNPDTSGNT